MMSVKVTVVILIAVSIGCESRSSTSHSKLSGVSCRCKFQPQSRTLSCSNVPATEVRSCLKNPSKWTTVTEDTAEDKSAGDVDRLRVSSSDMKLMDLVDLLQEYKSLKNLSLVNNSVEKLEPVNASMSSVVSLDLSHNKLRELSHRFLGTFPNLRTLNLAHNNLTHLPADVFSRNPHLRNVNLKSNKWKCLSMDWLRDKVNRGVLQLTDPKHTLCWYSNASVPSDKPVALMESCPMNCSCAPATPPPRLVVNCSGQGYHSLPLRIPPETAKLHMENNKISNLSSLLDAYNLHKVREKSPKKPARTQEEDARSTEEATLSVYRQLVYLFLDNNSLTSLDELENLTGLFEQLVSLTVTGNQLRQVPLHVVQQMFRNKLLAISLSGNPWDCLCNFTVKLNRIIINSNNKVVDAAHLQCSPTDPRNPGKTIRELREVDVCAMDEFGVHPLDVLNVCLGLIIVLCVMKLAYDWWYMKETGKLPLGPYTFCELSKCHGK